MMQMPSGQIEPPEGIMEPMKVSVPLLWRSLTVLALAALLLAVAAGLPRRAHPDALTVAVGLWPGSETLLLARERGVFPLEHVQLVEMTWASATMRALGNGVVDAAVLSLDEVMRLRESGLDLRVVMVMDASKGDDALMAQPGIQNLAGLKGKKVGVDLRAAGMYLLTSALEQAGMKSSDVELVPLNLPETEEAFTSGEVDAVVTSEPWVTKLRAAGGTSLFDSSGAKPPIYRVLVVSGQALREQREDVVRVVRAHFAMMKELRRHVDVPGLGTILRRQALSKAEFFNCWDRLKSFDEKENRDLLGAEPAVLSQAAVQVEEKMRSHALLNRPVSGGPWIDATLLKGEPMK